MKFLLPSEKTKAGHFTYFEDPETGQLFCVDDAILSSIPTFAADVLEGTLEWDENLKVPVLRCADGDFHAGAIVSLAFEGRRVRVSIQVLSDTDPAPAPSSKND